MFDWPWISVWVVPSNLLLVYMPKFVYNEYGLLQDNPWICAYFVPFLQITHICEAAV